MGIQINNPPAAGGGLGYALSWGANLTTTGRFAMTNGEGDSNEQTTLDRLTEHIVPKAGTITLFTYHTTVGDATTVFKIHKNGSVVETITASGAKGTDATPTTTVAVGDTLGVEYDANQSPSSVNFTIYIE